MKPKLAEYQKVDLRRAEAALKKLDDKINNPIFERELPRLLNEQKKWKKVKAKIVGETDKPKAKTKKKKKK